MDEIAQGIRVATTWILPVLFAVTLHEAAHGWVAWKLGDDTAFKLGRVTFNPLAHIDRFGTVVLPTLMLLFAPFMFGYAKPVPVRFNKLRRPRRDMILVAAAGPAANILLALVSAALLHVFFLAWELPSPYVETWSPTAQWIYANLENSLLLNLLLAVFNMLPLLPLDGGRIAVGVLPRALGLPLARLERYGILILLGLLVLPYVARRLGFDLNPLGWILRPTVDVLSSVILTLVGLR